CVEDSPSVEEILSELKLKVAAMRWAATSTLLRIGISPHSPYTVRPEAFRALAEYALAENLPVCIHAAESQAEAELLRCGAGTIADRFAERGIAWMGPPPGTSVVRYL